MLAGQVARTLVRQVAFEEPLGDEMAAEARQHRGRLVVLRHDQNGDASGRDAQLGGSSDELVGTLLDLGGLGVLVWSEPIRAPREQTELTQVALLNSVASLRCLGLANRNVRAQNSWQE